MAATTTCQLCLRICTDHQPCFNEEGQQTEAYQLAMQYFDPMFLQQSDSTQSVLCCNCCHHICTFHQFQESVIQAQNNLRTHAIKSEMMETKENAFASSDNAIADVFIKEEPPDEELLFKEQHSFSIAKVEEIEIEKRSISPYDVSSNENMSDSECENSMDSMWSQKSEDNNLLMPLASQHNNSGAPRRMNPTETELDNFIAKYFPNLQCGVCKEDFANFSLLQEHFQQRHTQEKCHTLCCGQKLISRLKIEEHLQLHNDPNAFQCSVCLKDFVGRKSLHVHARKQHGQRKKTSSEGEKLPKNSKQHIKQLDEIVAKWKPILECVVCYSPFSTFSLLRQHFRRQHPNEEFHIYCCSRWFNERSKFAEHARFHTDPHLYKCEQCGAQHNCKRNLEYHIRTYHPKAKDGEEPSELLVKKPTRRKRNITITSREIDYSIAQYKSSLECSHCDESCAKFALLKAHHRTKHPSIPFYIFCCQRKFNQRSDFENHLRLHINPNAFRCELCGKCLSSGKKLRVHNNKLHPDASAAGNNGECKEEESDNETMEESAS